MGDQLVSVIITTYKRENAMLSRAIDSVLNQTYLNYELIIVDDNSDSGISNNVKNLIEETNKKRHTDIKLISYGKNMGAQYARNAGIKSAKGEYIAFLDDDDEWLKEKLELQIERFEQCSEKTGLIYCNAIGNKGVEKKIRKAEYRGDIYNKLIYRNYIGSTSFPLIKRECFDSVGYFDEKLKAKQDYDMWLRICKLYLVDYVNEPLVIYNAQNEDRISLQYGNKLQAEIYFFEKYKNELMHFPASYSHRLEVIGEHYYRLNNLASARKYLKLSIKANRRNRKAYGLLFRTFVFKNAEKYYTKRSKIAKPVKRLFLFLSSQLHKKRGL